MSKAKLISKKDPDNLDTTILSRWPTEEEKVAEAEKPAPKPKLKLLRMLQKKEHRL